MRLIKLQPERSLISAADTSLINGLPIPYFIDPDNYEVGRQDIWKGEPKILIGFNDTRETGSVELEAFEWVEDPQRAVGMYPVFEHANGSILTYQLAVMSVSDMNV